MGANGKGPMTETERVAAFWRKVDRSAGPDACWPWTAATHEAGYGRFWDGSRVRPAHAYAWSLANGPLPAEKPVACHHCDNPPCCNPSHIFPGTHADNNADSWTKGRGKLPPPTPCGEAQHLAKLTTATVVEIRSLYKHGDKSLGARGLARRFGVDKATVLHVVKRRTWKHVQEVA